MKILFLDLREVLFPLETSVFFSRYRKGKDPVPSGFTVYEDKSLCPIALSNLEYILEKDPDVMVVITSKIREDMSFKELNSWIDEISPKLSERFLDTTPKLPKETKIDEIQKWLNTIGKNVSNYAILEIKDPFNKKFEENTFSTQYEDGLSLSLSQKVLDHFSK